MFINPISSDTGPDRIWSDPTIRRNLIGIRVAESDSILRVGFFRWISSDFIGFHNPNSDLILQDTIGFRRIPMGSDGFRWVPMGSDGFRWVPMVPMGSDGFRWFRWVPMGSDGFRWVPMGSDGFRWFRWVPMGSDGSDGFRWVPMGSDGFRIGFDRIRGRIHGLRY